MEMIQKIWRKNMIFLYTLRNHDLPKPHYSKILEDETGFEEIPVSFNENTFKLRKQKSQVAPDCNTPRIPFVASVNALMCYHF